MNACQSFLYRWPPGVCSALLMEPGQVGVPLTHQRAIKRGGNDVAVKYGLLLEPQRE